MGTCSGITKKHRRVLIKGNPRGAYEEMQKTCDKNTRNLHME